MQSLAEAIFKLSPPEGVFDTTVVNNLYPTLSDGARRALVHRAIESGEVLRIRRGLYILSREIERSVVTKFCLVERIYSFSCVSFESALSFHGLIPEAVFSIGAASAKRSRNFNTPLGRFSFTRVTASPFYAGVENKRLGKIGFAPIATPTRAIADLIFVRKEISWEKDGSLFLTDSMRIELEDLKKVFAWGFEEVSTAFKSCRVLSYLNGLRKELCL